MNHTLQTCLAWFGGISAIGYVVAGAWITAVGVAESRRIHSKRAALRARRTPITEAEIKAADIDELAELLKGDHQ